jgi:hypothetical protein
MKIYLSASLKKADEMKKVRSDLEFLGHEITSRWIDRQHLDLCEENQNSIRINCTEDLADIVLSQMIIIFSNNGEVSRGGRHVELGFSIAQNIPIYFIGKPENGFHYVPFVSRFDDYRSFMYWFEKACRDSNNKSTTREDDDYNRHWKATFPDNS